MPDSRSLFEAIREEAERGGVFTDSDGHPAFRVPLWEDVLFLVAIAESAVCRRFTTVWCRERPELEESELCATCKALVAWEVVHGGR
jgi:hypothetical protein